MSTELSITTDQLTEQGYTYVGLCDDVPLLEGCRATVGDRKIAVFHRLTGFSAIDAFCPHKAGPLHDGLVSDDCVTCPLHSWRINLDDGHVLGQEDMSVPVHELQTVDGQIWVKLNQKEASTGGALCDGDC